MDALLRGLVRVGEVSSVNNVTGAARVVFPDRSNVVSNELPVLKRAWPVAIGDQVVCLFLPMANADGFILDSFYTEEHPPPGVI